MVDGEVTGRDRTEKRIDALIDDLEGDIATRAASGSAPTAAMMWRALRLVALCARYVRQRYEADTP